jgi:hypothetical protein
LFATGILYNLTLPAKIAGVPTDPHHNRSAIWPDISWRFGLLVLAIFAAVLVVNCIRVSHVKPFWYDELLTYYFVSDPSTSHMLQAQEDLINTFPPLYFLAIQAYARVFGATELTLRLFSCLCVILAGVVNWSMLRRCFGSWPALLSVALCFSASSGILFQASDARPYGLFLAEVAAAMLLAFRLCTSKISWPLLIANAVVHAALVTTHYFGFLYSGAMLVACALCLVREPRSIALCVGSVMLGWTAFLPCIPALIHHLEISKPHGWIQRPGISKLARLFLVDGHKYVPALIVVCVAVLWKRYSYGAKWWATVRQSLLQRRREFFVLFVLNSAIAAVPIFVWLLSQIQEPLYVGRYFNSIVFNWASAVAFVIYIALAGGDLVTRKSYSLASLSIASVVAAIYLAYAAILQDASSHDLATRSGLPSGLPIVVENQSEFLQMNYYQKQDGRLLHVIDRECALDPRAIRSANTYDQIGTALKRNYPQIPIMTTEELLDKYGEFIVIDHPNSLWFERRISGQAGFESERVADTRQNGGDGERVWRVRRL